MALISNRRVTPKASLGSNQGKSNVLATGALASTAATADQVIVTYTVTAGKTLFLQWLDFGARLTTYAATATHFGTVSIQINGATVYTADYFHAGAKDGNTALQFPEALPVAAGQVVRVVCTPSGVTPFSWKANLAGYEQVGTN